MRNTVFLLLGFLELTVAVVLAGLGFQLPNTAEVNETFERVETMTERSGDQVELLREQVRDLRRPEIRILADRLRSETRLVTATLNNHKVDFDQVGLVNKALGDVAGGLDGFSKSLDSQGIGKLGQGLNTTADYLDKGVADSAGKAADHLEKTTAVLQEDAARLRELLRRAPPDLKAAREVQEGLLRFSEGLDKAAIGFKPQRLAAIREGFRGLEDSLVAGAEQVEQLSGFRYPVVTFTGLRPTVENRQFWPEGDRIGEGMRKAAAGVREAGKEMDDLGAQLPKLKIVLDESRKTAEKTREAIALALKQQDQMERLLKEMPEHTARLAEELPLMAGELVKVLRETRKLKEVAGSLRETQKTLDVAVANWPELRMALAQSATLLRATQRELQDTLTHRKEYEDALKQTVVLADSFSVLLPLFTQQLDASLGEQEHALNDLGDSLHEVNQAVPPIAHTASRLVQTCRLLIWLVAGIVALHGIYLGLSARLGKQYSL